MARKKRRVPAQFKEPVKEEDTPKKAFQDEFQSTVGKKIEEYSGKFEGKGKTLTYALAAVAVLAVIVGIFYIWNKRSTNAAQTALGKAIEVSQRQVTDNPPPAGTGQITYKTQKERAEAAIAEFQKVADTYGGAVGEKANYFVATNMLFFDRAAAIEKLSELSKNSGETGTLSKFALAQAYADDNKLDEAAKLYSELAAIDNPILAKETINFALAKIYEKQNKTNEAVELYFSIAKTASEAKDAEGNAVPMSSTARDAKAKVEELNPEKAKEIVEPESTAPAGGLPLGM
ncbi:MAG: hypothetical protein KIS76_15810 [Pyrinomonadaceae bacterium]|nr:hypothetical protein [Pyrinomonadaceae bacterium]